ncbi:DUF4422 domain-containing protein [Liquorilactobacillus capillatus]|nr:DUF4422 domain-containing protein [Liquorilactobacillus capillatus]
MYVITHKKFDYYLPENYVPLLVGAVSKDKLNGYLSDDKGDNISSKNKNFCELTGLYWIWKHGQDDIVGLSHYRRYFSGYPLGFLGEVAATLLLGKLRPISVPRLNKYLEDYDWILPTPETKFFKKRTVLQQFAASHGTTSDLETTRKVLGELYPEYLGDFDKVMNGHQLIICNMFYTRKEYINEYSKWLFTILFKVEKSIDISNYDEYQSRIYGFLSERLLNVWIEHQQKRFKIKYLNIFNTAEMNRGFIKKKIFK